MIESRLGRTVDGVLTLAVRGGLDDANRNQAIQRVADVGRAVVRLESLVEMRSDQLTAGTLGAETEKRIERQLATKLDASLLVDLDAPIGALLHAGVVGVVRPTFRELHFVFFSFWLSAIWHYHCKMQSKRHTNIFYVIERLVRTTGSRQQGSDQNSSRACISASTEGKRTFRLGFVLRAFLFRLTVSMESPIVLAHEKSR